ncbi:MAG: PDZ domain-containing protein, partial [Gemmatimonadales bacterium]
ADVRAKTASGEPLAVTRDSDISWSVDTRGADRIVVTYSTALRNSAEWRRANNRWFLRRTSGMVDGPRTFLYLDGWTLTPSHVRFRLPAGWRIATGLVPTTDSAVYWAPSYDVLIDSPALLGRFVEYRFTAGGVPHRVAVDLGGGRPGYPERAFVDMLRRISETTIGIFGGAPYKDYTFLFSGSGGGLEHLNSTTIGFNAAATARNPTTHEGVTAHELFHAWNVKRIRPAELGPFDYTRPARTLNLWVAEGVTDYYTLVILARSGLDSPADFARKMANAIESHRNNPSRLTVSPERSSWTVWDEPAANGAVQISYYLQGQLLGFLLDLAIRDSTDNRRSLDDVFRYLFDHHAGDRGYTRDDLLAAVRAAAGLDLQEFWRRYVSGTAEIPWDDFVAAAGWRLDLREVRSPDARLNVAPPAVEGGRPRAVAVPGSAAERAGLRSGDELVRVNGRPTRRAADAAAALRAVPQDATVTLSLLRDGESVTLRFVAEPYTRLEARLVDLPQPTDRIRRIRSGILTGGATAR